MILKASDQSSISAKGVRTQLKVSLSVETNSEVEAQTGSPATASLSQTFLPELDVKANKVSLMYMKSINDLTTDRVVFMQAAIDVLTHEAFGALAVSPHPPLVSTSPTRQLTSPRPISVNSISTAIRN